MAKGRRGPEPGSEKASRGGRAVRERYGKDFYSRISKQGGAACCGAAFLGAKPSIPRWRNWRARRVRVLLERPVSLALFVVAYLGYLVVVVVAR